MWKNQKLIGHKKWFMPRHVYQEASKPARFPVYFGNFFIPFLWANRAWAVHTDELKKSHFFGYSYSHVINLSCLLNFSWIYLLICKARGKPKASFSACEKCRHVLSISCFHTFFQLPMFFRNAQWEKCGQELERRNLKMKCRQMPQCASLGNVTNHEKNGHKKRALPSRHSCWCRPLFSAK